VVWGRVAAGRVANAIPEIGELEGTLRCLDPAAWRTAPELVEELVRAIAAPYGVQVELTHTRNVPPVDNETSSVAILAAATEATEGPEAVVGTEQSLGGEDFAWYLSDGIPGALARLGVRSPDATDVRDLHQGLFDADERAIPIGVRVLVAAALLSFS
jgi:amidohydrolase